MNITDATTPALAIDSGVLAHVVQSAIGSATAVVDEWQARPAGASFGAATAGVYHVYGVARDGDALVNWTVILKVIRPAASTINPAAREIDHPIYWKRELLAYESGLLDNLPGGITAPRCLATEERADESCWLWLEQFREPYGPRWPLTQYGQAARHLGRFNGAYLAGQPIPNYPWIGPPGALRGTLEAFAFVQDLVADPATWEHPLLRSAFPVGISTRLLRLWAERDILLNTLERMPITLCHKDAFRRNMFASRDEHGQSQLAMIDWAYLGRGELGLDIADLFGASYGNFGVETTDLRDFDAAIFDGYLQGLHEAGWQGNPWIARFGFAASASLKYAGLIFWIGDLVDEQRRTVCEQLSGQPIDIFVHQRAALVSYLLDLADEARGLQQVVV